MHARVHAIVVHPRAFALHLKHVANAIAGQVPKTLTFAGNRARVTACAMSVSIAWAPETRPLTLNEASRS